MSNSVMDEVQRCPLPPPQRHITTHRPDGIATFYNDLPAEIPCEPIRPGVDFYLGYTNSNFPVELSEEDDIVKYQRFLSGTKPGVAPKGGSVLRVCNLAPNAAGAGIMHRTVSLDYGIVTAGEMECWLDSGEMRHLTVGDIVVQRGTNHVWRNPSREKWARMV